MIVPDAVCMGEIATKIYPLGQIILLKTKKLTGSNKKNITRNLHYYLFVEFLYRWVGLKIHLMKSTDQWEFHFYVDFPPLVGGWVVGVLKVCKNVI